MGAGGKFTKTCRPCKAGGFAGDLFGGYGQRRLWETAATGQRRQGVRPGDDVAHPRLVAMDRDHFEVRKQVGTGAYEMAHLDVLFVLPIMTDRKDI
jgi:hypothetical protein